MYMNVYLCVVRTSGRYASYVVHSKCGCERTINRTHTIQHTVHAYQHIIYVVCTVQVLKFHITHSSYITTTSRGVHPGVCVPHVYITHMGIKQGVCSWLLYIAFYSGKGFPQLLCSLQSLLPIWYSAQCMYANVSRANQITAEMSTTCTCAWMYIKLIQNE